MLLRSPALYAGLWVGIALISPATAQTFVVDAAGGAGSQFLQVGAALAAVPDGATLLVRPGAYLGFTVRQGVTILGESGVTITGKVLVTSTTPQQSVTMRSLVWPAFPGNERPLTLDACQGFVMLEGVQLPLSPCVPSPLFPNLCSPIAGLLATGCSQLLIRDCALRTIDLADSETVLESTSCFGQAAGVNQQTGQRSPSTPGIRVTNGSLQISGATSDVRGGHGLSGGLIQAPAAPAIATSLAVDLRLLDGSFVGGMGGGPLGCCGAEAIYGSGAGGVVRVDPRAQLTSQRTPAIAGLTVVNGVMPALTSTGATAGGSLTAVVHTEIGDVAVLLVGFQGAPTLVPPFADPFWLNPAAFTFFAFGVQQASQPIAGSITVPPTSSFEGLRLCWQAAVFGSSTGEQASNPSVTLVH